MGRKYIRRLSKRRKNTSKSRLSKRRKHTLKRVRLSKHRKHTLNSRVSKKKYTNKKRLFKGGASSGSDSGSDSAKDFNWKDTPTGKNLIEMMESMELENLDQVYKTVSGQWAPGHSQYYGNKNKAEYIILINNHPHLNEQKNFNKLDKYLSLLLDEIREDPTIFQDT